jgi:hypothetical protein
MVPALRDIAIASKIHLAISNVHTDKIEQVITVSDRANVKNLIWYNLEARMLLDNEEGKKKEIVEEDSVWVRGKAIKVRREFFEKFELERHVKEDLVSNQRYQDAITQLI